MTFDGLPRNTSVVAVLAVHQYFLACLTPSLLHAYFDFTYQFT